MHTDIQRFGATIMIVWSHTLALGWGLPGEVEAFDILLRCGEWVGVVGKSNLCITSGDGGSWSEFRCRDECNVNTANKI